MKTRGAHEKALAEFRAGKARILLGTQMIAKGLDFPNVTLVGVIQADTALHLPDFRAAERTFQLVTQVAGRTGRGDKGGRVLVQTYSPDHAAIRAAVRHDFAAFAAYELPLRKMLHYPPFAAMVRLVVRGEVEAVAREFAERLAQSITQSLKPLECGDQSPHTQAARVLGPAPAPNPRIRGKYRFQVQLQGPDGEQLRAAVRAGRSGAARAQRRGVDRGRGPLEHVVVIVGRNSSHCRPEQAQRGSGNASRNGASLFRPTFSVE